MFKSKISKRSSLNIGGILCLGVSVFLISYILLRQNVLPLSIESIMSHLNHSVRHWHVLVIGLLPVYVALVIFGTAIVTIYLGSVLHRFIEPFFKK